MLKTLLLTRNEEMFSLDPQLFYRRFLIASKEISEDVRFLFKHELIAQRASLSDNEVQTS